jgi:hypothetical protein
MAVQAPKGVAHCRSTQAKLARIFGLAGDAWMRHANPLSVWTRSTVLPLLALAIWSRGWIGWWSPVALGLAIAWMMINLSVFPVPRSTRNWASKGVFGERVWPRAIGRPSRMRFRSRIPALTQRDQVIGMIPLNYGLVVLDSIATASGVLIVQGGKLWYIDRMVLLFEDVAHTCAARAVDEPLAVQFGTLGTAAQRHDLRLAAARGRPSA